VTGCKRHSSGPLRTPPDYWSQRRRDWSTAAVRFRRVVGEHPAPVGVTSTAVFRTDARWKAVGKLHWRKLTRSFGHFVTVTSISPRGLRTFAPTSSPCRTSRMSMVASLTVRLSIRSSPRNGGRVGRANQTWRSSPLCCYIACGRAGAAQRSPGHDFGDLIIGWPPQRRRSYRAVARPRHQTFRPESPRSRQGCLAKGHTVRDDR
jgi:hypothetical protein